MTKIANLWPKGTFSEDAGKIFDPNSESVREKSFDSIADAVRTGKADVGVIPHYNTIEGQVPESHFKAIFNSDSRIIDLIRYPVNFMAGIYPNSNDFSKIYSHAMGLAECSEWIGRKFRNSEQIPMNSTAGGAYEVADKKSGIALASENALREYGLEILPEVITNPSQTQNYTDFFIIARDNKKCPAYEAKENYLTLVGITPHLIEDAPGLLQGILTELMKYQLNLNDLFTPEAYGMQRNGNLGKHKMFVLEVQAHKDEERFKECMGLINVNFKYHVRNKKADPDSLEFIRQIGTYKNPAK